MPTRRTVLKTLAMAPIAGAVACTTQPNLHTNAGTASRILPIPPLAPSVVDNDGVRRFTLRTEASRSAIVPGRMARTWGFNGAVLGPTLRARKGERVAVAITNNLPEPTTVHWHGMSIPAKHDGGPHQMIAPGESIEPQWTIEQQAATLWYHPHPHGITQKHVLRGLAGMFLVDDDDSEALSLPRTYGEDDIPLVIQDHRFTRDGEIDESNNSAVGSLGTTIVTNGVADAYLPVRTEAVRLRILNGSAGRTYNLGISDNRRFDVIGTDGGLLPSPAAERRIPLSPGERVEIVIRMSPGENISLRSDPATDLGGVRKSDAKRFGMLDAFEILKLRANPTLAKRSATPTSLVPLPTLDTGNAVQRSFDLQGFKINGKLMDMERIDFNAEINTTEIWTVRNVDILPHNFHVHDAQFQVIDFDGNRPAAHLSGRKDTVYVPPGRHVRLALKWSAHADPAYPYMYHCHLLMHEDRGMMGQFLVLKPGQQPERLAVKDHSSHTHSHPH